MAHVTWVNSPLGSSVNSTMLWASSGRIMSRCSVTLDGGEEFAIARRPLPTFLSPSHSYTAPLPIGAPL